MSRRSHTPEQVVRKLREADRLLGEVAGPRSWVHLIWSLCCGLGLCEAGLHERGPARADLFEGWLGETHAGPPNVLERIDGACSILTVMPADEQIQRDDARRASVESRIFREINELIVDELGAARDELVDGVRDEFGHTSSREPADSLAAGSVATAGSGCALVALGALALASAVMPHLVTTGLSRSRLWTSLRS
jgi:hypothetical protein